MSLCATATALVWGAERETQIWALSQQAVSQRRELLFTPAGIFAGRPRLQVPPRSRPAPRAARRPRSAAFGSRTRRHRRRRGSRPASRSSTRTKAPPVRGSIGETDLSPQNRRRAPRGEDGRALRCWQHPDCGAGGTSSGGGVDMLRSLWQGTGARVTQLFARSARPEYLEYQAELARCRRRSELLEAVGAQRKRTCSHH